MRYVCKRYRYVNTLEDMQRIFSICDNTTVIDYSNKDYKFEGGPTMKTISVVNNGDRFYKITTAFVKEVEDEEGKVKYDKSNTKNVCTWIFDKTGEFVYKIHPSRVSRISGAVYKPFDIVKEFPDLFERDDKGKIVQSARPAIGYSAKYNGTEHDVVCYDLNSAYAAILIDKIIDTYNYRKYGVVGKGEIGFKFDDRLTMVHEGYDADYIFPLIDSPYKDFARKYYDIKKTAPKGSDERELAKQILVITVGLFQRVNPFLRAYIVNSCNEFIMKFVKKYKSKVCMWNTDAVYCTEHILELDALCGEDIGQFKVEYEGLFRQKGSNYQKVDTHEVSYRGIMKCLFDEDYNLLEDPTPEICLPYEMKKETYKIEKNKEFKLWQSVNM